MKKLLIILFIFILSGCATHPDEMQGTFVSPLKYRNHTCKQLNDEKDYLEGKARDLHTSLSKKTNDDSIQMGIGFLFWPTWLFLEGGDGADASKYSRLKGKMEAIEEISMKKNCPQSKILHD